MFGWLVGWLVGNGMSVGGSVGMNLNELSALGRRRRRCAPTPPPLGALFWLVG